MGSSPTSGTTRWTSFHFRNSEGTLAAATLIEGHECPPCIVSPDETLRGLGRLGGLVANLTRPERPHGRASPTLVRASAAKSQAEFPLGCSARLVDGAGRLKPQLDAGPLASLLGWQRVVVDTVIVDGNLTVRQQPEHVGVSGGRSGGRVGFTVTASGPERICLRPAHLHQLGTKPGDVLVLAAIPDRGALVIVNPTVLAGFAPSMCSACSGSTQP